MAPRLRSSSLCWGRLSPEQYRRRILALVAEIEEETAVRSRESAGTLGRCTLGRCKGKGVAEIIRVVGVERHAKGRAKPRAKRTSGWRFPLVAAEVPHDILDRQSLE
jgi:hypothetical protein